MADLKNNELAAERRSDGSVELRSLLDGTTLTFTEAEWAAFRTGVEAGEFGRFPG